MGNHGFPEVSGPQIWDLVEKHWIPEVMLNPSGINCPIALTVFPLEIERAIDEGESVGIRWGIQEDACVHEWAGKLVQQLLFTDNEPRSVVTSDNLVLWLRESLYQGLWRLDDVGRIWWRVELRDKLRYRIDQSWLIVSGMGW